MNMQAVIGGASRFFSAVKSRIICIIGAAFVGFAARVRGGVEYWRGRVIGGGVVDKQGFSQVYAKKFARKNGLAFGEAAALFRLAVGLPGHAKGGGALRGDRVLGGKSSEKTFHNRASINKPRGRVLVIGRNAVVQRGGALCQLVVDAPRKGESVFFMPR